MKKQNFFWSLLTMAMVAMFSVGVLSCDDDKPTPPAFNVTPTEFDFDIEGGEDNSFVISSNVSWKITTNKSWIKLTQTEGQGNATVKFDVEKNAAFGDDRKGAITITPTTGGLDSKYVYITQKGQKAQLEVSPNTPQTVKGDGGTVNFNITSNHKWQVSSNQSWLTVDKNEGDGNDFITATVEANGSSSSRSAVLIFKGKEGSTSSVTVTISQEPGGLAVSPTAISMLGEKGSTNTVTISATGSWVLTGCPDWLHASATSGTGTTVITLTALTENWSDEERTATLTFQANSLTASTKVSQRGTLPEGLRITTSNMTIMSDGFACDLSFGPNAKGYREAFFTEDEVRTKTDRDIYNELMKKKEYDSLLDYAFFPGRTNPETKLVYCVAAYGNENNDDNTHKYGPIKIERLTTRAETIYDDMYLTSSYNSSRWTVNAARAGSYGQRCDEYYYCAAEGDVAELYALYYHLYTKALIAHLQFKPMIAADKNRGYLNGPQTLTFTRTYDKFFCTTWGIDRDTKQFSAELSNCIYYDLTSSSAKQLRAKSNSTDWNKPHRRPTQAEIQKMRNTLKVYKVGK